MPTFDFYNVSRNVDGAFPGFGQQTLVQTKIVAVPHGDPAPAGGTINPGANAETHYTFDSSQTTLPAIAVDFYGSFPGN